MNNIELNNSFDNDIMYYLSDYCDKYNIDDIRNESQNVWSGATNHIGKNVFSKYITNNGSMLCFNINSIYLYNIAMYYTNLCSIYDKVPSMLDFSRFTLINRMTLQGYTNIDKSTIGSTPKHIPYIDINICFNHIINKDVVDIDSSIDYITSFLNNNHTNDIDIYNSNTNNINPINTLNNDIEMRYDNNSYIDLYKYSVNWSMFLKANTVSLISGNRENGLANNLISGKKNPLGTIAVLNHQYKWNDTNTSDGAIQIEQKANRMQIIDKYKGLI